MMLSLIEKIRDIISISDEEKSNLEILNRILRYIMQVDPLSEDISFFIDHSVDCVRNFVNSFHLDPWNYCHTLVVHMRHDAMKLKENNLCLGKMSMSRVENLGGKLKRNLKNRSNHEWCDNNTDSTKHCFFQVIRLMMIAEDAHSRMKIGDEEDPTESEDEN